MFLRDKKAANTTEYGLIAGLVAALAIASLTGLGQATRDLFEDVTQASETAGRGVPVSSGGGGGGSGGGGGGSGNGGSGPADGSGGGNGNGNGNGSGNGVGPGDGSGSPGEEPQEPVVASLVLETAIPAFAMEGQTFSTRLVATGTALALSHEDLPPGFTRNADMVSGTFTQAGDFVFGPFEVTSDEGTVSIGPFPITVDPLFQVTGTFGGPHIGLVDEAMAIPTPGATGGLAPYAWSVTGLPPGLGIDATTGNVVGTPTESGIFGSAQATVTDARGRAIAVTQFHVEIDVPVTIGGYPAETEVTMGSPYTSPLPSVAGGRGGYTFELLRDGVASTDGDIVIGSGTGVISANFTSAGTRLYQVRVSDGLGRTALSQTITFVVVAAGGGGGGGITTPPLVQLWTPATLGPSLLSGWYDASDGATVTLVDGRVAQLADKSGNNRHLTQDDAARRPTIAAGNRNGRNVLQFTGGLMRLRGAPATHYFSSTNRAVFVSGAADTITSNFANAWDNQAFWGDSAGYVSTYVRSTGIVGAYNYSNTSHVTTQPYTVQSWRTFTHELGGNQISLRLDGGAASSAATGTTGPMGIFEIGGQYAAGNAGGLVGRIGEVVVTSSALSTENRQRVEGYLAHRWGTTDLLPADHPFKNAAPTLQ